MAEFARYAVTEDGVSPYSIPGQEGGEFIASSYEHDIYGATSEDPLTKKIMTKKRHKKMQTFIKEVFTEKFK
jgi:2-oxoglutarate ferredoxin oxidoreductase subunit alpha